MTIIYWGVQTYVQYDDRLFGSDFLQSFHYRYKLFSHCFGCFQSANQIFYYITDSNRLTFILGPRRNQNYKQLFRQMLDNFIGSTTGSYYNCCPKDRNWYRKFGHVRFSLFYWAGFKKSLLYLRSIFIYNSYKCSQKIIFLFLSQVFSPD